jgi:hypothetical protein
VTDEPKQSTGCLPKGCLIAIIVAFALVGIVGFGGWFAYIAAVHLFTSKTPVNIEIEQPNNAAFQTAEASLTRLREAISKNRETTVAFTAVDLNALIAHDLSFSGLQGPTRISIADSTMTLELSSPLDDVSMPKLKGRWFNGTVSFSFTYTPGQFVFVLKSASANGHLISKAFFPSFTSSFNRSFNQSFQRKIKENGQGTIFWNHIKNIALDSDKIVITTQED